MEKIRTAHGTTGFDVSSGEYVDLFERGIIDLVKLVRVALLSEATLTEIEAKKREDLEPAGVESRWGNTDDATAWVRNREPTVHSRVTVVTPNGVRGTQIGGMAETLVADAPTLRRIAFLVVRMAEDDESLRRPMAAISKVIDRLKRSVVLGVPFERSEVVRLRSLVRRLERTQARGPANGIIGRTIIAELDDLATNLCTRSCGIDH